MMSPEAAWEPPPGTFGSEIGWRSYRRIVELGIPPRMAVIVAYAIAAGGMYGGIHGFASSRDDIAVVVDEATTHLEHFVQAHPELFLPPEASS